MITVTEVIKRSTRTERETDLHQTTPEARLYNIVTRSCTRAGEKRSHENQTGEIPLLTSEKEVTSNGAGSWQSLHSSTSMDHKTLFQTERKAKCNAPHPVGKHSKLFSEGVHDKTCTKTLLEDVKKTRQ